MGDMRQDAVPRVLVTGGAGFIGSHLCVRLVRDGVQVLAVDNLCDYYDVELKHERLQMLRDAASACGASFSFEKLDIANEDALEDAFVRFAPDVVVNLAAQAGVRYSLEQPRTYVHSNLAGFLNVLECCRAHPVRQLVYASSSSVYGDSSVAPFSEDERCDEPESLYAATKRANELMARSYAKLYGICATGLRFFTVYGPMGRPDMAYFKFTELMACKKPIQLYNMGNMLRDFTYVDDVVEAVVRIVKDGPVTPAGEVPHRVYNVGHGDPVQLLEFVDTLEEALLREGVIDTPAQRELLPMQPGDVHQTYADTTRLAQDYGFVPSVSLATGLGEFARWYAQWRARRSSCA